MSLEDLTSKIKEMASSKTDFTDTIKFDVGDGIIFLDGSKEGAINVDNEDREAATTVKMTKEDLAGLVDGSLNPMTAFMTGKLKIDGDMGIAMKLGQLLS